MIHFIPDNAVHFQIRHSPRGSGAPKPCGTGCGGDVRGERMKRGHSIAFAVMAVLAMTCAPLAAAGLGSGAEDTAIGTASIPEPKEYLYDLWTDDNNVKILSVRASIGGSDLVEITGERTSKGPISGFWDFDRGTGMGPFNSFYAAINIENGSGEDNGERMLNHRAGTIAFVLDPSTVQDAEGHDADRDVQRDAGDSRRVLEGGFEPPIHLQLVVVRGGRHVGLGNGRVRPLPRRRQGVH